MRILVLNGSPHTNGATSDMVSAFSIGAMEAGHEVISINVAHKNIKGCMACEYCREKEKGICVQKDDMQAIYPEILLADMVVFASPIYCFTLSAQLQAVIQCTAPPSLSIINPSLNTGAWRMRESIQRTENRTNQKKNGKNYTGSARACEKKGVLTWH